MALTTRLAFGVVLTFVLALLVGPVDISLLSALYIQEIDSSAFDRLIFWEIRLPRTLLAPLVGAALGLAGAAMQSLLRNPLADPSIIGASQGAALGAAIAFYFGHQALSASWSVPIAAFVGSTLALGAVLFLSRGRNPGLIILAGLAVASIGSALLAVVLNFAPNPYAMQELILWLLGSVAERPLSMSGVMLVSLAIGFAIIYRRRNYLQSLTLGESVAQSMGYDPKKETRWIVIGCASLVGTSVAVSGAVSFVGLVVPHLLRRYTSFEPKRLLIPSMLGGALIVGIADLFIRALPWASSFKLGVITALIGAPFFIQMVLKERDQWL